MSLIDSPRFLFSTNGAQFGHPDQEAVRRVIGRSTHGNPELFFNYLTDRNDKWKDADLQRKLKYTARYNTVEGAPFVVAL
jgi:hypothetical protein